MPKLYEREHYPKGLRAAGDPGEGGMLGERVSLKAYACPGCGKIEIYARRLEKERALIEQAKYTCK
ncbi:MAG: hypothetical protein ABIJ47_10785 [Candidatus Bathyarchaeota archaeon]